MMFTTSSDTPISLQRFVLIAACGGEAGGRDVSRKAGADAQGPERRQTRRPPRLVRGELRLLGDDGRVDVPDLVPGLAHALHLGWSSQAAAAATRRPGELRCGPAGRRAARSEAGGCGTGVLEEGGRGGAPPPGGSGRCSPPSRWGRCPGTAGLRAAGRRSAGCRRRSMRGIGGERRARQIWEGLATPGASR